MSLHKRLTELLDRYDTDKDREALYAELHALVSASEVRPKRRAKRPLIPPPPRGHVRIVKRGA